MDQLWGVDISGGSVERGNLTPDREAIGHHLSVVGRRQQVPVEDLVPPRPHFPSTVNAQATWGYESVFLGIRKSQPNTASRGGDTLLAIPDYVSVQCPRCLDDIHLHVDVTPAPAARNTRLMVQVTDFAGPFEQHYRDAGHVDAEDSVTVNVHTLQLN